MVEQAKHWLELRLTEVVLAADDLPAWKDRFQAKLRLVDHAALEGRPVKENWPSLSLTQWEDVLDALRAPFAAAGVPLRPRFGSWQSSSSTAVPMDDAAGDEKDSPFTPSPKKKMTETSLGYLKTHDGKHRGVFQIYKATGCHSTHVASADVDGYTTFFRVEEWWKVFQRGTAFHNWYAKLSLGRHSSYA
ncbi:unnamed protein product [Symbiodinium microadriaticum]|nr:unnamed protein product [Symbiodinium microadriaticum]